MLVSKVKIFDVEMCVYLERAQVRVDWEDVDQLQGGEDVGSRKQALQSGQVRSSQVRHEFVPKKVKMSLYFS